MEKIWTPSEITRLFRMTKTKISLLRDETNEIIPRAGRVNRGKSSVRAWKLSDLPTLGKAYGFLVPPRTIRWRLYIQPKEAR